MDLNNWQQTSIVTLVVSDGELEQEYRLTFGTCSNFDIGLFNRRRAKAFDYLRTFGDDWAQQDEANALFPVLISHAMIMAGLKRVECKDGDTWTATRLPASWYDAVQFAYNAPAGMVDTLTQAVIDAGNPPRLFAFQPAGDEEKKVLRLTVRPSAT